MAQESSTGSVWPLVYPQVRGPGFGRWFMACWTGFIGGGFIVFSIVAISSVVQGKFNGPPAAFGISLLFGLIGLGVFAHAVAIVVHRHWIVVDPLTRTVTRQKSWGLIKRTLVLPGEVSSVRLMHDTLRSGKNGSGFCTVCQLKVVTRGGELRQLSQRPEAGEAIRHWLRPWFLHRTAPDYEQLLRDDAVKLCAATGWRLDDRLERTATGFVPAASAPLAHNVEDLKPLMDAPAWLQRPAPRRVRRRGQTVLLSLLGWGVVVVPLVVTAIWVGADALSMRTTSGQLTGSARDGRGREAVAYRFVVDGREYAPWTPWDEDVPAALLAAARKREPIRVSYLPRDPHQSYLGPPSLVKLLAENWVIKNIKLIPSILVTIVIAVVMWRRANRIARAVVLGQRGRMSQGMVFRSAQRAGQTRTSTRLTINGLPIHLLWRSVEDNPNQIRYEFIVDGKKRFGYVQADLLGIFRPDGLIGVLYDPSCPELHLPLPVVERYLTFE